MRLHFIVLALLASLATHLRADISLKIGDTTVRSGHEAEVPIFITGSKTVGPLQFLIDYDPRLLEAMSGSDERGPKGVRYGAAVSGGMITEDADDAGEWRIILLPDRPIKQDGELLHVRFKAKKNSGVSARLLIDAAKAWDHESLATVAVNAQPGKITITNGARPRWVVVAILAGLALGAIFLWLMRGRKEKPPAAPPQS